MAPAPVATLIAKRSLGIAAAALLTLPYWSSGIAKLIDWQGALAEVVHFELEPARAVTSLIILVQLGGSLLVISGRQAWLGAGALCLFTALATLIAHPFWTVANPIARFHERNTFLEYAGLIGGLILAAIVQEKTR